MKKIFLLLALVVALFCCVLVGCAKEVHTSSNDCVADIVAQLDVDEYEVINIEELDHNETHLNYDVHCFDITIRVGEVDYRYYCFSVVRGDGTVEYVDCDKWGE